jgi:hypothetical protein
MLEVRGNTHDRLWELLLLDFLGAWLMAIHPLAGQAALSEMRIEVAKLESAYYDQRPDFGNLR